MDRVMELRERARASTCGVVPQNLAAGKRA